MQRLCEDSDQCGAGAGVVGHEKEDTAHTTSSPVSTPHSHWQQRTTFKINILREKTYFLCVSVGDFQKDLCDYLDC